VRRHEGRDALHRFQPGEEWKKLPDRCKAPNRGMRLKPRRRARIECLYCGKEVERFRRSAKYCGDECCRRAQLERDALRKGKAPPRERVRGFQRRVNARLKGIRKHGSREAYLRSTQEQERKRAAVRDERQFQRLLSQGSGLPKGAAAPTTASLSGKALERRPPRGLSRYVLIGR